MERYTKPKGVAAAMGKVGSAYLQAPLNRFMIPRPALQFLPPTDRSDTERTGPVLDSFGPYIELIKKYEENIKDIGDTVLQEKGEYNSIKHSTPDEKRQKAQRKLLEDIQNWNPHNIDNTTHDPFKTLFVGRLPFSLSEKHLKREFENYGRIREIHLIKDKNGNSRGYAFVEFEHEKDMLNAYRDSDGMKIAGRRIVVDVERGRTVKGWRPRRLGGGLGQTRAGSSHQNDFTSGRSRGSELRSISRKLDQYSHRHHSYHRREDDRDRHKRYRDYESHHHDDYIDDRTRGDSRRKRSRSPIEEGEMISSPPREKSLHGY